MDVTDNDRESDLIGEIGSEEIQYCKRVKYLEKVWILLVKNETYTWVDQDNIPLEKMKALDFQDDLPDK